MCKVQFILIAWWLLLCACAPVEPIIPQVDPASLHFDGQYALDLERTFVTQFTNRHSGAPNNALAVAWLRQRFEAVGLTCSTDQWQVINYSRPLPLQNLVCTLPGRSDREIVVLAHHDQSPATIQGADNDGSGIATMLHLAEILAAEGDRPVTVTFVSSDGEEYGMLGSLRFVESHPDRGRIVAALSLDNLGKEFYDGINISPIGQFRGYGPLWLQRAAQVTAARSPDLWVPSIHAPLDQAIDQAVPISFMDQGPLVAAGVPAIGFSGRVPAGQADLNFATYHSPEDTVAVQSAAVLQQSGRNAEALVRQLAAMASTPQESGPYLYLASDGTVWRGLPLWLPFAGFVAIFLAAGLTRKGMTWQMRRQGWRAAWWPFAALWLPWLAADLLLWLLVATGLMLSFDRYPALARDPILFAPRWPAVILFLSGLILFFWLARRATAAVTSTVPDFGHRRSLALLVVGLAGVFLLVRNPFSLLLMLPVPLWLLIKGRRGPGRLLDLLLFAAGGGVVYLLLYQFGFQILRNDLAILWYILMMFSIRMVSFWTTAVITAIVAAGASLVVTPPAPAA